MGRPSRQFLRILTRSKYLTREILAVACSHKQGIKNAVISFATCEVDHISRVVNLPIDIHGFAINASGQKS